MIKEKKTSGRSRSFYSTKEGGYLDQKKYKERHPEKVKEWRRKQKQREKGKIYEPKLRFAIEFKPTLENLVKETGMSLNLLCISALEEKYGIVLRFSVDNKEE